MANDKNRFAISDRGNFDQPRHSSRRFLLAKPTAASSVCVPDEKIGRVLRLPQLLGEHDDISEEKTRLAAL
ncbi:unnamed protein product [Arabidopsis halleri]